jgi:hypothetical protein
LLARRPPRDVVVGNAVPDDITDLDSQSQSGWGCGFSFQDPENNVWDVAYKYGSEFDHRGGFIYP